MAIRCSIDSDYAQRFLAGIFNSECPAGTALGTGSHYMALFNTMPSSTGTNYAEPLSGSYMRTPLNTTGIQGLRLTKTGSKAGTGDASGYTVAYVYNQEIIFFPEALLAAFGTIRGIGVFESQTRAAGKPILWGKITDSNGDETTTDVLQYEVPIFRINELEVDLY